MNKIMAAVLVVVGATIFGLVFIKQIRVNKEELADYFKNDYAGYSSNVAGASIIRSSSDSSAQLDRSIQAVDLKSIDSGSAKIEAQLKLMDQ